MKKTLCLVLLLSVLLSGCGLFSPSQPISAPSVVTPSPAAPSPSPVPEPTVTPAPEPTVTAEPEPPATPEPVVIYDALYEAGTYSDGFNNTWNYVLRIPAIQASGTDATRLNQELFSALYPDVKSAKDAMEEGTSLGICQVDYKISINGQLISIVCETDTDWGFESYYTVNFDASSKTEVTDEQLLQRFGMTKEQFLEQAVQVMRQHFEQNYAQIDHDQMYWDRYNKSVAKENFTSDCQLFVNDGGQLCMIVKLYSLAGADYYYHIFVVK